MLKSFLQNRKTIIEIKIILKKSHKMCWNEWTNEYSKAFIADRCSRAFLPKYGSLCLDRTQNDYLAKTRATTWSSEIKWLIGQGQHNELLVFEN